ncbi:HNH endonuclease [Actinomadura sp. 3N407]|uniref:HNH endonuclease n=1 Tax=Actinomadura sp. 3N407 TaxID=3457423 RepID=UPI003FCEBAAC
MDIYAVSGFYKTLSEALPHRWTEDSLREIALIGVPSGIVGKNEWLLKSDYTITLGRWLIESFVDLNRYVSSGHNIGHLFLEIVDCMRQVDPGAPYDDLKKVSRQLASFAWKEVEARRNAGRIRIDAALASEVWFRNDPLQRCYLCGYKFLPKARDRFLRRTRDQLSPLRVVDFTRPRGLKPRHISVELDHIIPVAEGGTTDAGNLRLACGWCNIVKSNLWSLHDAKAWATGGMEHPSLGLVTVPQPFWVLRVIATRGRCEVSEGCGARIDSAELFVAPRNPRGALTPPNLMVVCAKHDPWAGHRFVSPNILPKR